MIVGTHALLEDPVNFWKLGVAIIDEQHRFGVQQRGRLRGKGRNPHVLIMTATPIPRTLALTVYGDLDISVMRDMPPGRRAILTAVKPESRRPEVYALVKEQLAVLEERARGFADLERALQDTLVTGQRMSEELKATARREAQLIVDEAQLRSEKVLDAARAEEARIRADMHSLKLLHRQLAESVKVAVERYLRLADADLGEAGTE